MQHLIEKNEILIRYLSMIELNNGYFTSYACVWIFAIFNKLDFYLILIFVMKRYLEKIINLRKIDYKRKPNCFLLLLINTQSDYIIIQFNGTFSLNK